MSYARVTIRSNSIRIPPRGHALPCYSDSLREKHMALAIITPRTIAYPIQICCPDHCPRLLAFWICLWQRNSKLRFFMFLSFPFSLPWIPKNSPQSRIALVIKLLTKNIKTYTIWLELIAMVLELKGNNYYSKVFKRVNYKLWNNTFWVVIIACVIVLIISLYIYPSHLYIKL